MTVPSPSLRHLLTFRRVAEVLCVSPGMVYKLARTGELPTVRIGSAVRVDPSDLESFIEQRRTRNGATRGN